MANSVQLFSIWPPPPVDTRCVDPPAGNQCVVQLPVADWSDTRDVPTDLLLIRNAACPLPHSTLVEYPTPHRRAISATGCYQRQATSSDVDRGHFTPRRKGGPELQACILIAREEEQR